MGSEERIAKIEGIIEQMEKRLTHIESEIRDIRKDLNYRFFLLIGIQISMLFSIIYLILQTIALIRDITIPVLVIALIILTFMSMGLLMRKR
jgi:hypothetical protein